MPTDETGTKLKPTPSDTALPGNYPCLTLQLNITRYQSEGVGKMVLVVREPSDGVELHRVYSPISQWETVAEMAEGALAKALWEMRFLQVGFPTP